MISVSALNPNGDHAVPRFARSQQLSQGLKIRRRSRQMSLSEIMTVLIAFHD